jgi:hypothetical protein
VVAAVIPSASSPSVSPSQLAAATTWTTREARRAGRLSFTEDLADVEDMDNTVPGGSGDGV